MPKQADTAAGKTAATQAGSPTGAPPEAAAKDSPWSVRAFNGPDFEPVAEIGQRSLSAMAHLHSLVFRDALRFNAELLDFASRRVRADIETSNRLAHCDSVTEAMDVMSEFYQGALRDYAEESASLVQLGGTAGAESAEALVSEAATPGEKKTG